MDSEGGVIAIEGRGLHGGAPSRVALAAREGDTTLAGATVGAWRAVRAERATLITHGERSVRTVEHLFAALAALGAHRGVAIDVDGDEVPLVDGAAARWFDAIAALGVVPCAPRLIVTGDGEVRVGTSVYRFAQGEGTRVSIELEVSDARLAKGASWGGDARDFRDRIAPARTFCFAHEVEELAAKGLAKHVAPESVVVIGASILAAGAPFAPDEPARHKLLDLVGDLFLYGGPPRGAVHAYRPGHFATHEAVRAAFDRGLLAES